MDLVRPVTIVTLPEPLFSELVPRAGEYSMSPYYFARMLVARYVASRTGLSLSDLMESVPGGMSSFVGDTCELEDDANACELVASGYTAEFWQVLTDYSVRYGLTTSGFFQAVLFRYLEDRENPGMGPDLQGAFGLEHVPAPEPGSESEDRPLSFGDAF